MTYAELDRRTDRLANALGGLGYGDGSRIAVLSEMRPEFCELLARQVVIDLTIALDAPYWDAFGQTETSYLVAYGEVPVGQVPNLRKLPTPFIDVAMVDDVEGVQEACVIGIPDERWGESVKACIIVRSGHSLTAEEVVNWRRPRLASYKKPRYVEFLSAADVPRSVTGKILRGDLVQRPTTPDQVVKATNA